MSNNMSVSSLISTLASAASSGKDGTESAAAIIEELCAIAPVAAAAIDEWHPVAGDIRPLATIGYPELVTEHLSGPGFLTDDVGYRRLVDDPSRHVLSWGDVSHYYESYSVLKVFRPAGFSGGATARLTTRGGRYTGNLHLSIASDGHMPTGVMEALQCIAPAIASAIDPCRSWRTVVELMNDGPLAALVMNHGVHPIPDLPLLPLAPESGILGLINRVTSGGVTAPGLWCQAGQWYRLRLCPVSGGCLIWGSPIDPPHNLTARELTVLTLLTQGLSNGLIARRLAISERTTAHHVEHLMIKLNVPSRAAAAARAVEEGLRVFTPPLPPAGA